MNERIQQLALEAFDPINALASEGVADRHTFDQAWFQLYNKKFAELIVAECIQTIQMGITRDGHNTEKYLRSVKHIKQIREHFGVEE